MPLLDCYVRISILKKFHNCCSILDPIQFNLFQFSLLEDLPKMNSVKNVTVSMNLYGTSNDMHGMLAGIANCTFLNRMIYNQFLLLENRLHYMQGFKLLYNYADRCLIMILEIY